MPSNPRTEPVELIVDLLNNSWVIANTDNEKPIIVSGSSGEAFAKQAAGWITVYQEGPYRRTRNDMSGAHKTHKVPLTIAVHTIDRPRHNKVLAEVERVINLKRKAPDPLNYWDWIEDLGETPQMQYKNEHGTDVNIELWANSIPTAE